MDMFLYLDKDTFVHRLDPRTKIIVMILSFAIAIIVKSAIALAVLGVLIFIYAQAGRTLSNLKRIKIVLLMVSLMSIVLWSLTGGGPTKIFGPITYEGLIKGVTSAIKISVMIISGMIFLSATKMEEISIGLVKMGLPYRAAFAFSTAIRLVPTIVATSYTITQAQKSRGLDLDSGTLLEKVKKYVPLLIPTFVSVIRGTNVFSMALESKGFGYSNNRTNFLEIKIKAGDIAMLILSIALVGISIYLKIMNLVG
jgi:energy-coupling factor transport system permease protein